MAVNGLANYGPAFPLMRDRPMAVSGMVGKVHLIILEVDAHG